jgi:hypothetical protein
MLEELRRQLNVILEAITHLRMNDENRIKLYEAAYNALDSDASPKNQAPQELACAETVMAIERKAFPDSTFKPSNTLSTYYLYKALRESPLWKQVYIPAPGDLVISPTGWGRAKNPDGSLVIKAGHTGFVMMGGDIASNDSRDGIFRINYTLDSWKARYDLRGGYPVMFFRRV